MTKGLGMQSVNGIAYEGTVSPIVIILFKYINVLLGQIPEIKITSKAPRPETVLHAQERKELRVRLVDTWPGLLIHFFLNSGKLTVQNTVSQAKHWRFLKGFLPPFAQEAFVSVLILCAGLKRK